MKYFGITDRGKIRKDNQDCFLFEPADDDQRLIVTVCDGMGGAKAGGIASDVASKSFVAFLGGHLTDNISVEPSYRRLLVGACSEANGVVYQYSCFDSNYSGMGTTLVGGIVTPKNAYIANVGDSRAYHISKGKITQVTRDHSLVEDMVQRGEITREAARNHPRKNIITNALGLEPGVTADFFEVKLSKGDCLIFCSDGISNIIYDEEMLEAANQNKAPEDLCRELMGLALERNSPDNATVAAIRT